LGSLSPCLSAKEKDAGCCQGSGGEGKAGGGDGAAQGERTLTCDHRQGSDARESRDVDVHVLQVGGEFNNGVDPLPEATDALQPVQDHPVAEDQLALHWV